MEKWKIRSKVWEKLREGSILFFIKKLHGWDRKITDLMVKTWRDGKLKIDGVDFQVNEGVVTKVINSPNQGIKFYRDKKISLNAVKDFANDAKEMKELVNIGAYYESASIKKLWRFVLRETISYIMLDIRFDMI